MKVSKEEFVRNIIKIQAKRRARKEKETIAVIKSNITRCRKQSGKKHLKAIGQR